MKNIRKGIFFFTTMALCLFSGGALFYLSSTLIAVILDDHSLEQGASLGGVIIFFITLFGLIPILILRMLSQPPERKGEIDKTLWIVLAVIILSNVLSFVIGT